jgi:hypothetical protein
MPRPIENPEEPRGLRFTAAEVRGFLDAIEHAPSRDLRRHEARLQAAVGLGVGRCLDAATADRIRAALEARRLKLQDPAPHPAAPADEDQSRR